MRRNAVLAVALAMMVCMLGCAGCKAQKINVIHNDNVVTNSIPVKAFNDEQYIWEGWQFSTNQVNIVD